MSSSTVAGIPARSSPDRLRDVEADEVEQRERHPGPSFMHVSTAFGSMPVR